MKAGGGADGAMPPARLKIAYLLSQFPVPTQTFAASDIRALQADGHRVRVHTMKLRGTAPDLPDIPVSRPTLRDLPFWPRNVWQMRAETLALARMIVRHFPASPRTALIALACLPRAVQIAADLEREQVDVVHLFWARHAGLVLALLRRRGFTGVASAFAGAYDLVADDFLVDLSLTHADIAFSHSEANRAYLQRKVAPGTAVEIIHRGIPLPDHPPNPPADPPAGPEPETLRDQHRWITASALVPDKNLDGVLHALARARENNPQLRLSIFGEGPDRARLEQLCRSLGCADAVTFEGHVARDDLAAHMNRADLFLLLSKKPSERLPNVIKEALWAGCCVISSNSIGIRELLADDDIGQVVDPDDRLAVDRAVRAALRRDRSGDDMRRRRTRQLVEQGFSARTNMRRYVRAWIDRARGRVKPRTMDAIAGERS